MTSRGGVFFLQLLYLAALGALAGMYFSDVLIHRTVLGTLPIAVPWWGALGAVMLSLTGVFENRRNWLKSYAYWHISRPFVGVAFASFAVLAFQAGVLAVGSNTNPSPGSTTAATAVTNPKYLFYYLVAFIVGYREETARALVKRVGDVIIGPGAATTTTPGSTDTTTASAPSITNLEPATGPADTSVTVTGTGMSQVDGVTVAGAEVAFKAPSDTMLTFTIPGNGGGAVPVILALKDGTTLTTEFTYT
jgi:IPT/TIG domain-containing protein